MLYDTIITQEIVLFTLTKTANSTQSDQNKKMQVRKKFLQTCIMSTIFIIWKNYVNLFPASQRLTQRLGKLIRAGSRFGTTFDSGKSFDGVFYFHSFYKAWDSLKITVAATYKIYVL